MTYDLKLMDYRARWAARVAPSRLRADARQVALLAMFDCVADYDPSRSGFLNYATMRARWAVLDMLRREDCVPQGQRRRIKAGLEPEPRALPTRRLVPRFETVIDIKGLLRTASDRERDLLFRHFWLGESQTEISQSLGISQGRVWQILRSALDKMQAQLSAKGRIAA